MDSSIRHELFLRLLAQYERQLRLYVQTLVPLRSDVDDILQDTTVLLWKKFEQFDAERPFLTWAAKFAYFEVLKYRQRQSRRRKLFSDELVELLADERQAHHALLAAQEESLRDCVARLPAADRELLQLRYGASSTLAELAADIAQPVDRLYRELARIRRLLAGCIQKRLAVEGGA